MKHKWLSVIITANFGLMAQPALAWWDTGHMVTAQIAYERLQPALRKEADRLIQVLAAAEPATKDFVPASVWMDGLKARGLSAFDKWHYINLPYNAEGLAIVPAAKEENVVWAINQAVMTLREPRAGDFQKALMLRILLHCVGDIHQPFHNVGRISTAHPEGDRGGNLFALAHPETKNIHAFWDNSAQLFPAYKPETWAQQIPAFARQVTTAVPINTLKAPLAFVPERWSQESFALVMSAGYDGIQENTTPSPAYIKRAQQICQERLALGGYRLAQVLNEALQLK